MDALVREKLPTDGYFLLDEAQHVEEWERLAASLLAEGSVECIITGSNASLLKSELGTLLTGQYSLMPVFTLFFPEFRSFTAASLGDQAPLTHYDVSVYSSLFVKSMGMETQSMPYGVSPRMRFLQPFWSPHIDRIRSVGLTIIPGG